MSSRSSKLLQKSSTSKSITHVTLTGFGNLIKLLPTATVFMFQFLNPVLTNNGHCHTINKYMSSILIAFCGFSCCFASFTDSYTDNEWEIHYGIATRTGVWPSSSSQDLSSYKLRFGDFVHAFFSLIVFAAVSLLDPNSVECFYPSFESTQKVLLMVLPPVIGAVSGSLFVLFPNTRHGIGYPSSQSSNVPFGLVVFCRQCMPSVTAPHTTHGANNKGESQQSQPHMWKSKGGKRKATKNNFDFSWDQ